MPKRTREYEARKRETILTAALACFAGKGYHRTTVDDIGAEAGLSKGAIYKYYRSKEDLFLALFQRHSARLMDEIGRAFAEASGGTIGRIGAGADVYFAAMRGEYGRVARVAMECWAEAMRQRKIQAHIRRDYRLWKAFLVDLLRNGVSEGEVRRELDLPALAALIIAISDGLTLARTVGGVSLPWSRLRTALVSLLVSATEPRRSVRRARTAVLGASRAGRSR